MTVTAVGRTGGAIIPTTGHIIAARDTGVDMDKTATAGTMDIMIAGGTIQVESDVATTCGTIVTEVIAGMTVIEIVDSTIQGGSGVATMGGMIVTGVIAGMRVIGFIDSIVQGDKSVDAMGGTTAMQTAMANRAGTTATAIIVQQATGLGTYISG